ncbi:MAG: hypothetical protein K2I78_04925, partial [Clostridia bacterium]|nr:hypothetical protein [Clostridia bacterium]
MEINFIAVFFLLFALGFAYLSKKYALKKYNFIWLFASVLSAGFYILLMLMDGSSLFDTALGIMALTGGVYIVS